MTVEPGYPITLVHPRHRAAKPVIGSGEAVLELFPPVTVSGADSEAQYRAQGYLRYGEPAAHIDYHEFPKILRHPEYREGTRERVEAKIEDGKMVGTYIIPAVPTHMPDVTVYDAQQEEEWRTKDYKPAGEYRREVLDAAIHGGKAATEHSVAEWPKWIDGVLVERDPSEPEALKPTPAYPRWEGSAVVQDPRFEPEPDPKEYPKWIHVNGVPGEASILVKNPREEFEAHQRLVTESESIMETEQNTQQPGEPLDEIPQGLVAGLDSKTKPVERAKRV